MTQLIAGAPTDVGDALEGAVAHETRRSPLWLRPLEALSALLLLNISVLLLVGVVSRYVFSKPIVWSDEVVSLSFIWLTMLGSAIAVHRNEHLRLSLFVDLLPQHLRSFVRAFALVAIAALLLRHALPNAVAPVVNVVMINLAYLVVGVVVVEVVFVYPGMGQYLVDHVAKRDVPVVQACGLVFAGVYIGLNLIADLVSILANPRLRHPK